MIWFRILFVLGLGCSALFFLHMLKLAQAVQEEQDDTLWMFVNLLLMPPPIWQRDLMIISVLATVIGIIGMWQMSTG